MSPHAYDRQRKSSRVNGCYAVEVETGDGRVLNAESRDLSFGGIYVVCAEPLLPGSFCQVRLHVPECPVVAWSARVSHRDVRGMGMELFSDDGDADLVLRRVMSHCVAERFCLDPPEVGFDDDEEEQHPLIPSWKKRPS